MDSNLSLKILNWKKLFSGDFIYGTDISFNHEFEALKEEVDKSTSVHSGVYTDWESVLNMADVILSTQSKDLWSLCYSSYAALEIKGLGPFTTALGVINELITTHWNGLYPPTSRIKRRCAPFEWLHSRLDKKLSAMSLNSEKQDVLVQLKKELETLNEVLDFQLLEHAPSFNGIIRIIPDPIKSTQAKETTHKNSVVQNNQVPQNIPPTPLPSLQMSGEMINALNGDGRVSASVLPQLLRTTQEQAQQLATHYLSYSCTDWRVYYLNRVALWGTINQLPQVDATGNTQMRILPRDKVMAYQLEVDAKRYAAVLPQLEGSAGRAPFWFDGHYMVARCLEGLEATAALKILGSALGCFIQQFPALIHYKFHDSTPFASPKTIQWLESLSVSDKTNHAHLSIGKTNSDATNDNENILEEALIIYHEKGFNEGLKHLGAVPSGRSRAVIVHGLLRARYCLAAGKPRSAGNLLQALYSQLEQWDLLDWEPELSAQILSLLLSQQSRPRGEQYEAMVRQLHWLHLNTAMEFFKE